MAIQGSGFFMRGAARASAALLMLALAAPVWASPRVEPGLPAQERGAPSLNPARQEPLTLTPPVPPRGQLLYENHCMACHESVVHIRTRQHARTRAALQAEVVRWSAYLRLHWSAEDIAEVVRHLDTHYYRFESRP